MLAAFQLCSFTEVKSIPSTSLKFSYYFIKEQSINSGDVAKHTLPKASCLSPFPSRYI